MHTLIGLSGPASVGKDSAAKALTEQREWVRVAFADPVRDAALALDPYVLVPNDHPVTAKMFPDAQLLNDEDMFERLEAIVKAVGWDMAKSVPEIRRVLQRLGTDAGREIHGADCWVKIAHKKICDNLANGLCTVVTDVRFDSEADFIREHDGIVVKMTRPGYGPVNDHISDQGIASYDVVINNDSGIVELHTKILSLVDGSREVLPIECRECGFVWRAKADPETWNERCPMCEHFTGEPVG